MKNLEKIVIGFAGVNAPSSPELLRIGAVISALSRIVNHYRIKIKDGKTIDTYCNFYFLFMGASGVGKDMSKNLFRRLDSYRRFLEEEKKECEECEKKAVKNLCEEFYKFYSIKGDQVGFESVDKDEKRKAMTYARGKIRHIQPIMSESTRPNLEAVGLAVMKHNKIGLTITNSEFLMWMKHKKSEAFEMFSFLADAFDNGHVAVKGTVANNRGSRESEIEDLPMNAVLMSSEFLLNDKIISDNLKDFFMTAGARRFSTASEKELDEPLYTKKEIDERFHSLKNEADIILNEFISNCRGKGVIEISGEVLDFMDVQKIKIDKFIGDRKDITEIMKIELKGSLWRTLKMAGILSILNVNDKITITDFKEAYKINKMFINSFKNIVANYWTDKDIIFYQYIKKNKGCKKGDLYNLSIFSRDKRNRKTQYDDALEVCKEVCLSKGEELIIEKGSDGKSFLHTIVKSEEGLKKEAEKLKKIA